MDGVRQEVREVKGEEKGEIKVEGEPHTSWAHVDEMTSEHKTHDLSQSAVRCATVTTRWLKKTMHSSVRVDVLCVENSHGGHVVIGVGREIVQRHHASIMYLLLNSHF